MSNQQMIILAVEDDPNDLFFLKRVLEKAGYASIHHVDDGKKAIDYLAGHGTYKDRSIHPLPDLIFLDLKLPEMMGHEVLQWIVSQPALKDIRVFVLTSSDERRDRERIEKLGAAGYLVKPLMPGQLDTIFG
ncbi:MAG TPA: response regulator [Opitutaceae bacterium]|nr:response regulator [Opitutaceae bacterium]